MCVWKIYVITLNISGRDREFIIAFLICHDELLIKRIYHGCCPLVVNSPGALQRRRKGKDRVSELAQISQQKSSFAPTHKLSGEERINHFAPSMSVIGIRSHEKKCSAA